MCDCWSQNCQNCWNRHFYKQYMEQHSAMTQWFHQVSQPRERYSNYPNVRYSSYSHERNSSHQHESYARYPNTRYSSYSYERNSSQQDERYSSPICERKPVENSVTRNRNKRRSKDLSRELQCPVGPQSFQEDNNDHLENMRRRGNHAEKGRRKNRSSTDESLSEDSRESNKIRDDIIGSGDEIYFDPGCLFELGNHEDSSSEKSDEDKESFELVDSVVEEFEYVHLDKFGHKSRKGRKGRPHAGVDLKIERETREYLYGGKADTIAGLETAMSLDFIRLCDLYQPHLWPVLPVRLSKA